MLMIIIAICASIDSFVCPFYSAQLLLPDQPAAFDACGWLILIGLGAYQLMLSIQRKRYAASEKYLLFRISLWDDGGVCREANVFWTMSIRRDARGVAEEPGTAVIPPQF